MLYSGPPLIRTPLLPNNSVLIREVSFGEREYYIHNTCCQESVFFIEGCPLRECPLREGPLYKKCILLFLLKMTRAHLCMRHVYQVYSLHVHS